MPSLAWFLSPVGIALLALLDASVILYLPFALDVAVIYMAARDPGFWWLYPLLANAGWVAGSGVTYWVGARAGSQGLHRWVSSGKVDELKRKVRESGILALAATGLVPPPFPAKPVVLAAGALSVSPWKFFPLATAARVLRQTGEAYLGRRYGDQLVGWMHSDIFLGIVWGFIAVAVLASAWAVYSVVKGRGEEEASPGRREQTGGGRRR